MKAELRYARFAPTPRDAGEGYMWCKVIFSFIWKGSRRDKPYLEAGVRLRKDRAEPFGELEKQAQAETIALLREALAQLEARSLSELDRDAPLDLDWDSET